MNNTLYFASLFKQSGVPRMKYKQLAQIMNIVHLESKMEGIKTVQKNLPENESFPFGKLLYDIEQDLLVLTNGKKKPQDVLQSILDPNSFDTEH